MKGRIKHIDTAKGISIILVALYHSPIRDFSPQIVNLMGLFRMPLFFFLSGVFFSYAASSKDFFLKKSEALLKPYFFVLIVVYIISSLVTNDDTLWQLRGMLYGTGDTIKWIALWFLTHLFVVYSFSYILFRFTRFNAFNLSIKLGILSVFILIGPLCMKFFWNLQLSFFGHLIVLPGLPFSVDLVFITSTFFISGHLLKEKIINFSPSYCFLFICFFIFSYIALYTDAHINFYNRVYMRPILSTIAAFSGIYIVMCISSVKSITYIFTPFGKASLYILIFHMFINKQVLNLLSNNSEFQVGLLGSTLIAFFCSIFLPLLIKIIISNNKVLALFFLPIKSNKIFEKM